MWRFEVKRVISGTKIGLKFIMSFTSLPPEGDALVKSHSHRYWWCVVHTGHIPNTLYNVVLELIHDLVAR